MMRTIPWLAFPGVLYAGLCAAAVPGPSVPSTLADVRSFAVTEGDRVWRGYGEAPFDFLLIDGDKERLLCREPMPDGFEPGGKDPVTGCAIAMRARSQLPDSLLAAMPVFGPPSTIVMGTPASTGRSPEEWTLTVLHEHFHQWQDALPDFYPRVAALGLADGDQTGMWMLNFPFPYDRPDTIAAFGRASQALGAALDARGRPTLHAALSRYLVERRHLAESVGEKNWRYAEFELWKEGVARWTEIELGKNSPDAKIRASAKQWERSARSWLDKPDIAGAGREFVYPYGAAEAMLLEACGPAWRTRYPRELALGPLFEAARHSCRG